MELREFFGLKERQVLLDRDELSPKYSKDSGNFFFFFSRIERKSILFERSFVLAAARFRFADIVLPSFLNPFIFNIQMHGSGIAL